MISDECWRLFPSEHTRPEEEQGLGKRVSSVLDMLPLDAAETFKWRRAAGSWIYGLGV